MILAITPHHFCFRSLFQIQSHNIPRDIFIIEGGIHNNNSIRLILYIGHMASIIFSPQSSPCPYYSNCQRFLCSISYRYMKSINHIPSP
jgi:hypothetical protein